MIWYDDLFIGESIRTRSKKRIVRRLNRRIILRTEYLLTIASNPDNLIDIISLRIVRQRYYPRKDLAVIGLAGNYEEALILAGEIVSSIYAVRGDFNLREFFKDSRHTTGEDSLLC